MIYFQSLPAMPAAQLVTGRQVRHTFQRHSHTVFCIGLVERGRRRIDTAAGTTLVLAGQVFLLNPDEAHVCRDDDDGLQDYRVLCLPQAGLQRLSEHIAERPQAAPRFAQLHPHSPHLQATTAACFALLADPAAERLAQDEALLHVLACLLFEETLQPPRPVAVGLQQQAVQRACDFIQDNYRDGLTLEQIAGVACLSPFYFQRVFVRQTGLSPHEYLLQCRLRHARRLLAGGLPPSMAAVESGFYDQSHFNRCFKRVYGLAPGEYCRKSGGEAIRGS